MWCHRRRRHVSQTATEAHPLASPMEQVSVERWLEDQTAPGLAEQYSQDMCPICLSSLTSPPSILPPPEPSLPRSHRHLYPHPSPAPLDAGSCRPLDASHDSAILVLNRCNHAFHLSCLSAWFEYRRYRCPICQASYSPAEQRRG
ncbi:hypothetical protein NUU61_007309 [Penicillium alfredii]|uniref:RING-type domain-containing protein n=1 Tax=Penicillium alfredii TaxID=1506179 RepID=A0A9W9F2L8_9EURO|nr:uncharacterized protein NUU61_007309 [Penicillium alfredii]KAJ5092439.1 hypothetical protein NUU61_007309 [Penicillium alfredii]